MCRWFVMSGYMKSMKLGFPFRGLVLSPLGEKAVSREDRVSLWAGQGVLFLEEWDTP